MNAIQPSTVRQCNTVVYLHELPETFTKYSLYMKPHNVLCPSLCFLLAQALLRRISVEWMQL